MTEPFLLHMLGIPGAGKTTFLETFEKCWTKIPLPYLLGFDQVMQSMPEYQAKKNKVEAFHLYELPARERGYTLLSELIAEGKSILFDNGGSAATHIDILKSAKAKGYNVILVSITTPIEVAKHHVDKRSIAEGRHTPMEYLEDRASKLENLKGAYMSLTPHFYEIENSGLDFAAFEDSCYKTAKTIISLIEEKPE